jgi:hypothetical protein
MIPEFVIGLGDIELKDSSRESTIRRSFENTEAGLQPCLVRRTS